MEISDTSILSRLDDLSKKNIPLDIERLGISSRSLGPSRGITGMFRRSHEHTCHVYSDGVEILEAVKRDQGGRLGKLYVPKFNMLVHYYLPDPTLNK